MKNIDDEIRFDFYTEKSIESLRNTEEWSDKKIARFLRAKATELHPLRKTKKLKIPKEFIDDFINKLAGKYLEENKQ